MEAIQQTIQEEIPTLDNLFSNPKSRNFVIHMMYSYCVPNKIHTIWEWSSVKWFKVHECSLSKTPLISLREVREIASNRDELVNWFEESTKRDDSHIYGKSKLAVYSVESKTLLSYPMYLDFCTWMRDMRQKDQVVKNIFEKARIEKS